MATAPEMSSPRRVPAWRQQLAAFWRWWTGELIALVPERIASLGGASRVPLVSLTSGELLLLEPASAVGPDSRVDVAALDEGARAEATRRLLERTGETRARVRLCLEPAECLVRRVRMPAATEENLRQVITFEMDRLTPFRAEDVYFDCRVLSRDAAAGMITVQLALARREIVDAKLERLRALGTTVTGVTVRDERGQPADLELLPSETLAARYSARERYMVPGAIGLVVLLALVALGVPLYYKRAAVMSGFPLLDRARQEAEATDNIAHDVEKQVADYNFLLTKKHGTFPVLALLEEVTRLLPDNTWVQQIDIKTVGKTREVQVSGETPSSSKLIEIFESSPLLHNAQTRGTVTRGSQPNLERFMIVAEPRPRPAPESTSLLEAGVPVATPATTAPPAGAPKAAPPAPAPAKPAEVKPIPAKPGASR
ncbi:MAG TPA: pilus assembly protein PilM [Usitatibacter sp.]|jgi:general secretion pathway protein L|nr:pilus assembly protein PilM [Usitatibacter sp.]